MHFRPDYIDRWMLKKDVGQGGFVWPVGSFYDVGRCLPERMQSDIQYGDEASFCTYDDVVIARVEFEIANNNKVPVRHSTSAAVSCFGLIP